MAITFCCPGCGKQYQMPDETAGRKGKCKQCGTSLVIPVPTPDTISLKHGKSQALRISLVTALVIVSAGVIAVLVFGTEGLLTKQQPQSSVGAVESPLLTPSSPEPPALIESSPTTAVLEIAPQVNEKNINVDAKPAPEGPDSTQREDQEQNEEKLDAESIKKIVIDFLEQEAGESGLAVMHYRWSEPIQHVNFKDVTLPYIPQGDTVTAIYHEYRFYQKLSDGGIGRIHGGRSHKFYIHNGKVVGQSN